MKTKVLALLVLFLGIYTVSAAQIAKEDIEGAWVYKSVKDRHGSKRREVSNLDTINFNPNGTFYYFLQKEKIFATGVWRVEQKDVVLQYHPFPLPVNCEARLISQDTLVYVKEGKIIQKKLLSTPEVFYLDFDPEAVYLNFIVPANSGVQMATRRYAITEVKKNKLIIREGNIYFSFKR